MKDTQVAVVVSALEEKAKPLFRKLPEKITTKEQYEDAASNMKVLKSFVKDAEKEKKQLIEPLNNVVKKIRDLFRPFEDRVSTAESYLKAQMAEYVELSQKKIAKVEQDLEDGKIKKVTTAVRKQNELQVTSNVRKVWVLVCTDETLTPRRFMVPDEQAIKQAIQDGVKVPGWKMEQQNQIVI